MVCCGVCSACQFNADFVISRLSKARFAATQAEPPILVKSDIVNGSDSGVRILVLNQPAKVRFLRRKVYSVR